jgi:hypothetical protein
MRTSRAFHGAILPRKFLRGYSNGGRCCARGASEVSAPLQTENQQAIFGMKTRFPIVLSAALLVAAILLVFRDELQARGPHRLNRVAEPATQCGFWGDMSAGMSCR